MIPLHETRSSVERHSEGASRTWLYQRCYALFFKFPMTSGFVLSFEITHHVRSESVTGESWLLVKAGAIR